MKEEAAVRKKEAARADTAENMEVMAEAMEADREAVEVMAMEADRGTFLGVSSREELMHRYYLWVQ